MSSLYGCAALAPNRWEARSAPNAARYGGFSVNGTILLTLLVSGGLAGLAGGADETGHRLALPAYDQCIKASHVFNLLDARGVISVTERQAYIFRVRELAKGCAEAWVTTAAGGAQGHA